MKSTDSYSLIFDKIEISKEYQDNVEDTISLKKKVKKAIKAEKDTESLDPYTDIEKSFTFSEKQNFIRNLKSKLLTGYKYNIETEHEFNKTIGILYSGGIDSTTCILRALDQGHRVIPIINTFNDIDEELVTYINLNRLYKKFAGQLRQPIFGLDVSESFCNNRLNIDTAMPYGYTQQPLSAISLAFIDTVSLKIDEFQVGYIRNDDAISYEEEWKMLYHNARLFTQNTHGDVTDPDIVWPLKKYGKYEVVSILHSLQDKYNLCLLEVSCDNMKVHTAIDDVNSIIKIEMSDCCSCHKCTVNKSFNIGFRKSVITIPYELEKVISPRKLKNAKRVTDYDEDIYDDSKNVS